MARHDALLDRRRALLWVVDMQERLLPSIAGHETVIRQVIRLLEVARRLGVPTVVTEQYPRGLGGTIPEVAEYMDVPPLAKTAFSAFAEDGFGQRIRELGRDQIVLAGIETHICVYEGALDALGHGYQAVVVADATGAGRDVYHQEGLAAMAQRGVDVLPSESVIYQLLGRAGTDEFRGLLGLLRRD